MILWTDSPLAQEEVFRAIDAYVMRRGADRVSPELLTFHAALAAHSQPSTASALPPSIYDGDAALVSYTEAATALRISKRTIGRMVARGELKKVGQRITAASVNQIGKDRHGTTKQP